MLRLSNLFNKNGIKSLFIAKEMDPEELERKYEGMYKIELARNKFIEEFAKEKGWSLDNLTFEQFCEIKKEKGWIKPEGIENV